MSTQNAQSNCTCGAQENEYHLHDCPLAARRQADASAAENIWAEEHGIPTRDAIARDLLECPKAIERAELRLNAAKLGVAAMKDHLADEEAHLLLKTCADGEPFIRGKNEAARSAMLRAYTEQERGGLRCAEAEAMEAERAYNLAVNHFRALRSTARLLSGNSDD